MENVFVFLFDNETVSAQSCIAAGKGYALETVLPRISDKVQVENLRRCCPDGQCCVWGVPETNGNRSTWDLMAENDVVLGYRQGSIISAATVLLKIDSPSLAIALWGGNTEEPYRLMCFTGRPYVGEVPIVSQMLSYLDQNYTSYFTRLNPEKCENILHAFGSLETFVRLGLRYDFPFNFRHSE